MLEISSRSSDDKSWELTPEEKKFFGIKNRWILPILLLTGLLILVFLLLEAQ